MKEALIKYFNKEFIEGGVEFIDFEKLYPRGMTDLDIEFTEEKFSHNDIGFKIDVDEISGTFLLNKIDYFLQMGIPFRRKVDMDMETYVTNSWGQKAPVGGIKTFKFDVKLDVSTIPENLLKSLLGISKYNL